MMRPPMGRGSSHSGTLVDGGRYEIRRRIGLGGFKSVWLAHDRLQRQDVAIAILQEIEIDPAFRERFWQEAQILSRLTLDLPPELLPFVPRVVEFLNFGELKDAEPFRGLYLITRYIEGRSLRQLKKDGHLPLSWQQATVITIGILEALELSHAPTPDRGPVIHRDIKPANIMVDDDQQVTVLDFGIAKLMETSTGAEQSAVVGTLQYMAPEQFEEGARIGPETDLFGVAAVLHELMTGRPPWDRNNLANAIMHLKDAHEGTPPPLKYLDSAPAPDALKQLVVTGLAFRAEKRWSSAKKMREALLQILTDPNHGPVFAPRLNLETSSATPLPPVAETKPSPSLDRTPTRPFAVDPEWSQPPAPVPMKSNWPWPAGLALLVGVLALLAIGMTVGRRFQATTPPAVVVVPPPAATPAPPPPPPPATPTKVARTRTKRRSRGKNTGKTARHRKNRTPKVKKVYNAKADRLARKASDLLESGHAPAAKLNLERCLLIEPKFADCHGLMGRTLMKTGKKKMAAWHFKQYLDLDPAAIDADEVRRLLGQL